VRAFAPVTSTLLPRVLNLYSSSAHPGTIAAMHTQALRCQASLRSAAHHSVTPTRASASFNSCVPSTLQNSSIGPETLPAVLSNKGNAQHTLWAQGLPGRWSAVCHSNSLQSSHSYSTISKTSFDGNLVGLNVSGCTTTPAEERFSLPYCQAKPQQAAECLKRQGKGKAGKEAQPGRIFAEMLTRHDSFNLLKVIIIASVISCICDAWVQPRLSAVNGNKAAKQHCWHACCITVWYSSTSCKLRFLLQVHPGDHVCLHCVLTQVPCTRSSAALTLGAAVMTSTGCIECSAAHSGQHCMQVQMWHAALNCLQFCCAVTAHLMGNS
jgi:hypothetical protein